MTYPEAEKFVSDNLYLTGNYGQIKTFPFYIKHLVIVPKNKDLETQLQVFKECSLNEFNNERALISLGLLTEDLDVIIMGIDGGFMPTKLLTSYLLEIENVPADIN